MTLGAAFPVLLVFNVFWFGAGAYYFGLTPHAAARLLMPRSARASPLVATFAASVRFLGGLNLALAVMAVLLLSAGALFPDPRQRALFATVFGLAHASQVAANLPALGERRGDALWPVRSGPMLRIFVVDLMLAVANAALAIALLARDG